VKGPAAAESQGNFSHPLRFELRRNLRGRQDLSPSNTPVERPEALGNVSYHFSVLAKAELIAQTAGVRILGGRWNTATRWPAGGEGGPRRLDLPRRADQRRCSEGGLLGRPTAEDLLGRPPTPESTPPAPPWPGPRRDSRDLDAPVPADMPPARRSPARELVGHWRRPTEGRGTRLGTTAPERAVEAPAPALARCPACSTRAAAAWEEEELGEIGSAATAP